MRRLADGITGPDAALFLDRRTRCHAFSPDELQQAGVTQIIAMADELWQTDGGRLAQAASESLDLEGLRQRAYAAAAGEGVDVVAWAMDALLVGAIVEAFPQAARERALIMCEEIVAAISSAPEAFEDAAEVAVDRARHERPSRMPALTRELIGALRSSSRLATYDAEHEHETPPSQAVEQMEAAITALKARAGEQAPVGGKSWLAHIKEMLAFVTGAPEGTPELQFAANSASDNDYELLREVTTGKVYLVRTGRELWIEWQGSGNPPTLVLRKDDALTSLEPEPIRDGVHWRLDPSVLAAELELHFGADTVRIPLPR
jgi:hypothetical protein